jgi:voltage-gated potassium channel
MQKQSKQDSMKTKLHEIIFEADTKPGKIFDISLLLLIIASVLTVIIETIPGVSEKHQEVLIIIEWSFTVIFTIEYILRIWITRNSWLYIRSTYGIIDLLSILPTYIALLLPQFQYSYFLTIRAVRLLRVFRILRLGQFIKESRFIMAALKNSRAKILVFMYFVLIMVTIIGSAMYLIEGGINEGFNSIPKSIYWAIVTLTTVGYGDIAPITDLGRFFSALVMIIGYAVIAVPTGIITSEALKTQKEQYTNTQLCQNCHKDDHEDDAKFCSRCGHSLHN